jgi:hypothetical protein
MFSHTFGNPPHPSAISRAKEPVDTTGTFLGASERPNHMIDPFPNWLVIWSRACCKAKSFFDVFSSPDSLPSDLDFLLPYQYWFLIRKKGRHLLQIHNVAWEMKKINPRHYCVTRLVNYNYIITHMNYKLLSFSITCPFHQISIPFVAKLRVWEEVPSTTLLSPCYIYIYNSLINTRKTTLFKQQI